MFEDYKLFGLTPTQFYILKYLFENKKLDFKYLEEDLDGLQNMKFIKITSQGIILRQSGKDLFEDNQDDYEKLWEEFENKYPKKSGVRRLHDKKSQCKRKYLRLVKADKELHSKILEALDIEFKERKIASSKGEFMPDWKMMSSYINQEAWNTYLENIPKDIKIDWSDDKI